MAKLKQCTSCKKYTPENDCGFYNPLDENDCKEYELPYNNSEGMFKHLFSFKGRIRRLEYCMTYFLYWLFNLSMKFADDEELWIGFVLLWMVLAIPVLWITFAQGAKRCHDLGHNGFFQFIPFYILWMFFVDGTDEVNRFGTSPKRSYEEQIYKSKMGTKEGNITQ